MNEQSGTCSTPEGTPTIRASVPVTSPPAWAIAERALFELIDRAWPEFERLFCKPDGSLRYEGQLSTRDGGDDFYETFFNWPQYYLLGGKSEILGASQGHWKALTAQLTELGILKDEFEIGYDWFHQGESLLFAYFLSAVAPAEWAERGARFAELYADPSKGNFDQDRTMVLAPHNGAAGARTGLSDSEYYPWLAGEAVKYGFPLDWMEGSPGPHADFGEDPRLGHEMHQRLGRGDVVGNLSITGLMLNAFVLTGDDRYAQWIVQYTDAWKRRADEAGGLVPDNVGIDGVVGSQLGGREFGGHYGWSWPHGLYSIGQATAVAALAAATITGDLGYLDLPRSQYDAVIDQGKVDAFSNSDSSVAHWWSAHLGADVNTPTFLVPYRRNDDGWFDWNPVPMAVPFALWHYSGSEGDLQRLRDLRGRSGHDWRVVRPMREKEEAGHEEAWFTYLEGDNPDYPESILKAAQYQVRRRMSLMSRHADDTVDEADIHLWQLVQPVVTEALCQLTLGAPQVIYNGGQLQARVRWFDAIDRRPGLPHEVAALVTSIDPKSTRIELVNLSATTGRRLILQAGGFAEHTIQKVTYDELTNDWAGSFYSYIGNEVETRRQSIECDTSYIEVELPAGCSISLEIQTTLRSRPQTYSAPWEKA